VLSKKNEERAQRVKCNVEAFQRSDRRDHAFHFFQSFVSISEDEASSILLPSWHHLIGLGLSSATASSAGGVVVYPPPLHYRRLICSFVWQIVTTADALSLHMIMTTTSSIDNKVVFS
jgi:hypothetical protein